MLRFFWPRELKQACDAVDQLLQTYDEATPDQLGKLAKAYLRRHTSNFIPAIRAAQMTPKDAARLSIASSADVLVCSGQFHIYRGTPSLNGHALLSVFLKSSGELAERGQLSAEKHMAWLRRVTSEIREIG